jgi:hypothetical protein
LTEDTKAILRRVGNVLLVVGIADIAGMIYTVSSGHSYSSSFNVLAVIAGIRKLPRQANRLKLDSGALLALGR